jgi:hypothetical protein
MTEAESTPKKSFALGDILSITTGRLVSTRHMEGVYEILNFMTGANLFTHQLPAASRECEPELLKQFPQLGSIKEPNFGDPDEVPAWLQDQKRLFGETLEVEPFAKIDSSYSDPIGDAVKMFGSDRVVVVTP